MITFTKAFNQNTWIMKALVITTVLFFITLSQVASQNLFVNSYIEKTIVSPKAGVQVGYQFACKYVVGVFYQKEMVTSRIVESNKPRFYEKEFLGINLAAPLLSFYGIKSSLDVRIGTTNRENFAITPSLKLDYELINRIHINGGLGIRSLNPTLQGGIRVDIY